MLGKLNRRLKMGSDMIYLSVDGTKQAADVHQDFFIQPGTRRSVKEIPKINPGMMMVTVRKCWFLSVQM